MPRRIEVAIVGDSASLERAFGRAKVSSSGFVRSLGGAGSALATVTKRVGQVGLVLAGAGVAAAKFGADFQDTMQRIVGLSGVAQGKVDEFSKQILELAPKVGKSPQELARALYFITSSGISASKAIDVLTNSAKASVAGLGATETVADAVTSAINAYGEANLSAKHATDILVAAVREGKGEADAIAGSIGNVAALASQLGVKFNEVGAALAAETRLGIDAQTASVQLQQVFSNLVKVAPQAEKAFRSVGLSSAGLRKELADQGLIATLTTIRKAFGDNLPALSRAFPNIRALRGVLALIGKDSASVDQVFAHLRDTSDSLNTAFGAVSRDTAQHFRQLKASAEVAGISIGAAFAPLADVVANALGKASEKLTAFVSKFSSETTIHGKLNVIWGGVEQAGKSAESQLRKAVASVDWEKVWADARGIADGLQKRLDAVDWSSVGKAIGDGIAQGVAKASGVAKELAQRFEDAFRSIDWNKLGRSAGPGIAAAMLSALATVADPSFWVKNWDLVLAVAATVFTDGIGKIAGKLAAPLTRLLGDTFLRGVFALHSIAPRVAEEFLRAGEHDAAALARGFAKAGELVGRVFERLAKRIGRPLAFVVKVLGLQAAINAVTRAFVGIANVIRHALDAAFRSLKVKAVKAALDIIEPFTHLPKQLGGGPFQAMKRSLQQTLAAMQQTGAKGGAATGTAITQGMAAAITGGLAAVRDASETAAKVAAGVARSAASAAASTVAAGSAATRTPAAASSPLPIPTAAAPSTPTVPRKGITADQRNNWFDSRISRMLDRVQDLPTLKAQIARLGQISKLISDRIKVTKDITRKLTLEDQLVNVRRQIKPLQQQQKDAAQFFQLGLGPTGDARIPQVANLKKQLASIQESVSGTTLDTAKTQATFARIGKVLAAGVGHVSQAVRAQIAQMIDGIRQQLKDSGPSFDKFAKTNQSSLLKGLGLDPAQLKALRARLSQVGTNGLVPRGSAGALAGIGGGATIQVHSTVKLNDQVLGTAVTKHQQRTKSRNPDQRRGLFPGGV